MSGQLDKYNEMMTLAVKICRLAEGCYKEGYSPEEAMRICRHYFHEACDPLFHAAAREAVDMMATNPEWGK